MSGGRALRKIVGPNGEEETGDWRKLFNEELHSTPHIIRTRSNQRGGDVRGMKYARETREIHTKHW
jgi:hypothetical protein